MVFANYCKVIDRSMTACNAPETSRYEYQKDNKTKAIEHNA